MERPAKSRKKVPAKKPKKTADGGKITQKPKAAPSERFLRVKQSIQKKIVLPHQHERNLNTGILKFLVPGLPRGHMNSMHDEAKNTGMIWKIGWKLNGRSSQRKYLKGHKFG